MDKSVIVLFSCLLSLFITHKTIVHDSFTKLSEKFFFTVLQIPFMKRAVILGGQACNLSFQWLEIGSVKKNLKSKGGLCTVINGFLRD